MSLVNLVLRIATRMSLLGRTFSQERVYDSSVDALDVRVAKEAGPFTVVFTDDETGSVQGKAFGLAERKLSLTLHFAVTRAVLCSDHGGVLLEVPESDYGLEASLDFLRRQTMRQLLSGEGPWPEVWRALVTKIEGFEVLRGADATKGVRFAAREIKLMVDTLAEPEFVGGASPFWAGVLDLMKQEDDLADIAVLLEGEINGDPVPDWRRLQALHGLTTGGVTGSGLVAPGDINMPLVPETITASADPDAPHV